jgi:hypothetical protein
MTPESTMGNLCGSRIESVIGMIYKTNKASTLKGDMFPYQAYTFKGKCRCAINDVL